MSDAQAAMATDDGVPPAAQDALIEEAPGFKVFAGNLAYSTTDEGLKTFFAPVQSDIISAQIIMRGHRSAGYGFVAVSTLDAAQLAVESLNGQELDGRKAIVEIAKPADQKDKEKREKRAKRRPGRRGAKPVPGEVTEAEAEANGDVKTDDAPPPVTDEADKPKKKKKISRKPKRKTTPPAEGEATIDAEEASQTLATEAPPAKKQPRRPRVSRPPRPAGQDPVGEPSKTMLFVANLGFNIDDEGLSALFTDVGINVVSARVVRGKFGRPKRSKGYGFVDVGSEEEQQRAIEAFQGKEVGGRLIAVKIAVNATKEEEVDNAGPDADADADAPAA